MKQKESKLSKHQYQEALKQGVYLISFLKKDETIRHLKGTLMETLIPKTEKQMLEEAMMIKPSRKPSQSSVAVYDIEKAAWRSFAIDNVILFKKLD